MHMDGDECLKLDALKLAQVLGGLIDERVEQIQKSLVGGWHHLFIVASIGESLLSITRPHHLYAK